MLEPDKGPERHRNMFGRPAAGPLGQIGWTMFDWANQPYALMVAGFVFTTYFAQTVVGDTVRGQQLVGYAVAAGGLLVALLSPVAGAIADVVGRRKPWIFLFSILYVLAVAAHWFALPDAQDRIILVMLIMVLAGVSIETAVVFNNAMLPEVAPQGRIGFLSGAGFGIGYVGGMIAFAIFLVTILLPATMDMTPIRSLEVFGLPLSFLPDAPLFNIDPATHEHSRAAGPYAALWYAVFIVPLFVFTPDRPATGARLSGAVSQGLGTLAKTVRKLPSYGNIGRFLLARMIYNDALVGIFVFGSVYASGIFGWQPQQTAVFGLVLAVFAAAGAFVGGWLDDRIGPKRTVQVAIASLFLGGFGTFLIDRDSLMFIVPMTPADPARFMQAPVEWLFLSAGALIGLGAGPVQAASRSLMARLVPEGNVAEFYGLYAFSGKATVFIAPLLVGIVTGLSGDQRTGMVVIGILLITGFILLLPVREERAQPV